MQISPDLGRPAENASRVAEEVRAAAEEGARLIVFPEAALTGYLFESAEEARAGAVAAEGPELAAVVRACRETGAWAVVGAIERGGPGSSALYNTAFVLGPDGFVGRQRKVHTLCLGADRFTRSAPDGFRPFDLPFGRIGVHLCYDGSFPESPRALRLAGARLLLLPTNWPDLAVKTALVRVRAYENHAFYLAVNRTGTERGVEFKGGSCAADPFGRLLLETGSESGRHHLEIDLEAAADSWVIVRAGEYEYDRIADRRPEAYRALAEPLAAARRTGSRARSHGPGVRRAGHEPGDR